MSFGAPSWFWALLALPALALLFLRAERRSSERLRQFVSPRLLPQLAGTIDRFRRLAKFLLLLAAVALAIASLARPQWGYSYEEVKRKGLDLIFAVDTSRSMLSTDIPPNRLQRVKLAAQDLMNLLEGDRVGLIAFAGRAFLQAPLTIDYNAAVEAINDLDTNTIPEGGTNISDAITLALQTYGKSAIGNRALVIFTDGEELSGDAAKTAKTAADNGVRVFAIGVGTPEGSLIPISGEGGGTAFVKDRKGQVVKSKLDEKRLREIAQATGGLYLLLANGPRTMQQLYTEGLRKMQAGEINDRPNRRPIERYEWPLGAAILALVVSVLMKERKRVPRSKRAARRQSSLAPAALLFLGLAPLRAAAPGMDAYREQRFEESLRQFQQTLRDHPGTQATEKLQFDTGAAAYKLKDYGKALESFSQALLSPDRPLQESSHYNLGNTLYQRGDGQKADDKKETDWNNALQHYDGALKLNPGNKEAKENADLVRRRLAELKQKREQQPSPTPSPPAKKDKSEKPDKSDQKDQKQSQNSGSSEDKQEKKDQSGDKNQEKPEKGNDKPKSEDQQNDGAGQKGEKDESGASPSPATTPEPSAGASESPSPSPVGSPAEPNSSSGDHDEKSPSPGPGESASPSPSPGNGTEQSDDGKAGATPTPLGSPNKTLSGDVKGADGESDQKPEKETQLAAEAEANRQGQMSPEQAERLVRSMKDEEERVQLDERKAVRRVYNDW